MRMRTHNTIKRWTHWTIGLFVVVPLLLADALLMRELPGGTLSDALAGEAAAVESVKVPVVQYPGGEIALSDNRADGHPRTIGSLECAVFITTEGFWAPHCQRRTARVRYAHTGFAYERRPDDEAAFTGLVDQVIARAGTGFAAPDRCDPPARASLHTRDGYPEHASLARSWTAHIPDHASTPLPYCAVHNGIALGLVVWLLVCTPSAGMALFASLKPGVAWTCPRCGYTQRGLPNSHLCPDCGASIRGRSVRGHHVRGE